MVCDGQMDRQTDRQMEKVTHRVGAPPKKQACGAALYI